MINHLKTDMIFYLVFPGQQHFQLFEFNDVKCINFLLHAIFNNLTISRLYIGHLSISRGKKCNYILHVNSHYQSEQRARRKLSIFFFNAKAEGKLAFSNNRQFVFFCVWELNFSCGLNICHLVCSLCWHPTSSSTNSSTPVLIISLCLFLHTQTGLHEFKWSLYFSSLSLHPPSCFSFYANM